MLAGLEAFNSSFIADLNNVETSISQVNQQISSGTRVSQPSDDPSAIDEIIQDQTSIDRITQVQSNLSAANLEASAADGALQNATSLINQLISIAAETSNGIPSSQSSSTFVQQVQSIQQQMINLANTSVQGRYIFGGDQPTAQPYSYTPGSGNGYVQNTTPSSTATLMNADGSSIVPRMTAAAIFDNSSSGSVLQAISSLSSALSSNNAASVQTAGVALKSALAQVEQATTFYGNVENWIQQSQQQSVEDQNALTQDLSQTKDTDMAAAATQLSLDQTALQAALAAHGSLSIKSLFDYLG